MRYVRLGSPLPAIAILAACLSVIPLYDTAFAWPLSKPKTNTKLDENIRSMRQKAERGMMEAQMVLAKWCFNGDILPKDHAGAARWYEMAAKQGNAEAMMALAKMLNEGDGIPKDVRKGCEWYVAAARKGNADAYRELGGIFESGEGVTADKDKAIRLYEEGAKRGNAESALRLARIYESDSGPGDAEKRDHYLEIASALESDADKESIFLGGLYNQKQIQAQDRSMERRWSPDDHADEWGFDGQIASTASEDTPAKQPYVITEEDRRYDQELQRKAEQEWSEYLIALGHKPGPRVQRKAEQEWNEHARQTGGMVFVGELGSGQLDSSSQNKSGQARQPQDEEAAIAYATRIGGLVGGAAGLEYQLNQMIEDAKRYQDIAEYSADWNQQVEALRKAEALIQSIPQIKGEYYDAENALISLRVRDGQLFDDAMRATISTPEVDPIIRAYCRRLIGE